MGLSVYLWNSVGCVLCPGISIQFRIKVTRSKHTGCTLHIFNAGSAEGDNPLVSKVIFAI